MKNSWDWLAFISYKHDDIEWARWLQERLEQYRLPSYLAEDYPDIRLNLKPIFRDETDLGLGYLDENIKESLSKSEYLIVICSTNTPKSTYVCDEVSEFIRQGKVSHIIPFIIEGAPEDCFPAPLLALEKMPLAANVNEISRDYAAVKVIAALLGGVAVDKLWQRHLIAEEKEKERLLADKRRLQTIQSRFLSEKAADLLDEGDIYTSRMLLMEALPTDINDPEDRPLVKETLDVLKRSVDTEHSGKVCLIHKSQSAISDIDVSNDGKYAAVGLYADMNFDDIPVIKIIDLNTGAYFNAATCDNGVYHGIDALRFSNDGKYLYGYGFDSDVILWDRDRGQVSNLNIHDGYSISSACWIGNTNRIAIAVQNNTDNRYAIIDYDADTKESIRLDFNHAAHIEEIGSSCDGKYLAYSTSDKYLSVLSVETRKVILKVNNHSKVTQFMFNPQNSEELLGACANDNCFFLTHLDTKTLDRIAYKQADNGVFAYKQDGKSFIFDIYGDQFLVDTKAKSAKQIKFPENANAKSKSVAFSRDGMYMAYVCSDGVYCLHTQTRAVWRVATSKNIIHIAFCGDTYKLIMSVNESGSGKLQFIDLNYLFSLSNTDVRYVSISPDGRYIAYLNEANYLFLKDVADKNARLVKAFDTSVSFVTKPILFSSNGRYIATLLLDGTAHVYDVITGDSYTSGKIKDANFENGVRFLNLQDSVLMVFVENNTRLVFAVDEVVGIWDFRNSKLKVTKLRFKIDDIVYKHSTNTILLIKGYEEGICASLSLRTGAVEINTLKNVRVDGNNIITADDHGFNIYNASIDKSVNIEIPYYVRSIAVSSDNKYVALESPYMPHIMIVNLETKETFTLERYSDSNMTDRISLYFEDDGHVLISVCDTNISRWLLDRGTRQVFKNASQIYANGNIIAELKNGSIQLKTDSIDQELIDELRERFSLRSLTNEEKTKYFLDDIC